MRLSGCLRPRCRSCSGGNDRLSPNTLIISLKRGAGKKQVCAKFAHTAGDGKVYQISCYNLDVIISVGYRVKSQNGTKGRVRAISILKDHLIKECTVHQKRLAQKAIFESRQMLNFLANTLNSHDLIKDERQAVLQIVETDDFFNDKSLVTLTLLIAASDPDQKIC